MSKDDPLNKWFLCQLDRHMDKNELWLLCIKASHCPLNPILAAFIDLNVQSEKLSVYKIFLAAFMTMRWKKLSTKIFLKQALNKGENKSTMDPVKYIFLSQYSTKHGKVRRKYFEYILPTKDTCLKYIKKNSFKSIRKIVLNKEWNKHFTICFIKEIIQMSKSYMKRCSSWKSKVKYFHN